MKLNKNLDNCSFALCHWFARQSPCSVAADILQKGYPHGIPRGLNKFIVTGRLKIDCPGLPTHQSQPKYYLLQIWLQTPMKAPRKRLPWAARHILHTRSREVVESIAELLEIDEAVHQFNGK